MQNRLSMKRFWAIICIASSIQMAVGQVIVPSFQSNDADTSGYQLKFGKKKILPKGFEKQAIIALAYFPELENISVEFEIKKDLAALTTMPTIWSIFKRLENRTYVITISNETIKIFESILLKNLSYDAQIGVLGHELSHVSDFQHYGFWDFVVHAIKYTFSQPYGDKFEYQTDFICIKHGLGYQLKAWSEAGQKLDVEAIKTEFNIKEWNERYMYPKTIDSIISVYPLYKEIKN